MFQTVLFDFDGTVFDTVDGITKSIQFALSKHGRDAELEELRCFAGPPLVDKFMEVYGVTQEEAEQLVVDFRERYRPIGIYESAPFPGIRELAEKLHAAGKKWEVVLRAMQACGAEKETTVLVGDTKYDAAGARKAGIPCIGVRWGYAAEGELEQTGVPIAETMEELYRMLTEG